MFARGLILPLGHGREVPQNALCGESGMLEQKQVLSALLHFARASVEYREISEGIVREKSQSSPGFPLSTGRHAPPTLVQYSSSS